MQKGGMENGHGTSPSLGERQPCFAPTSRDHDVSHCTTILLPAQHDNLLLSHTPPPQSLGNPACPRQLPPCTSQFFRGPTTKKTACSSCAHHSGTSMRLGFPVSENVPSKIHRADGHEERTQRMSVGRSGGGRGLAQVGVQL